MTATALLTVALLLVCAEAWRRHRRHVARHEVMRVFRDAAQVADALALAMDAVYHRMAYGIAEVQRAAQRFIDRLRVTYTPPLPEVQQAVEQAAERFSERLRVTYDVRPIIGRDAVLGRGTSERNDR